ncbi:MAG: hypothetical protein ACKOWF_18855 [Chloroflexota bacterium]
MATREADNAAREPETPMGWDEAFDRCVRAFYEGNSPEAGAEACDRALSAPDTPPDYRVHARRNLTWCASDADSLGPHLTLRYVDPWPGGGWSVGDASIAAREDGAGFMVLARCEREDAAGGADSGCRYCAIDLDESLAAAGEPRWLDLSPAPDRLVVFSTGAGLAAAGVVPSGAGGGVMIRWRIDSTSGALAEEWRFPGVIPAGEGWAPVAGGPPARFVCRIAPTAVVRVDDPGGNVSLVAMRGAPALAREFRIAGPVIEDGDGWLAIFCQWVVWEDDRGSAIHRFARFGPEWSLTHLSGPIILPGLENGVASGLLRRGERLLLSGPAGAEGCWVATLPASVVAGMLRPVGPTEDAETGTASIPAELVPAWLRLLPPSDDPGEWQARAERLRAAGALELAAQANERVLALPGDDLMAGRAAFAAALILSHDLGRWSEAVEVAGRGVLRNPELPELCWVAAYASYWAGQPERAARWARAAIGLNAQIDAGLIPPRRELADVTARLHGPWDLLRHALWRMGDQDAAHWAEYRYQLAAQRDAYSRPVPGTRIAREPDRALAIPAGRRTGPAAMNPAPRVVYCCWTGDNPLPPLREQALWTIRECAGTPVELVTPANLSRYIVEPLHPAYHLLSLTHRSDYLRAYLMHHHGGGYTDLKFQSFAWTPWFELLDATPWAYFCGCREHTASYIPHREPFTGMEESFLELCGQIHFLFRPLTVFTAEWMDKIHLILDRNLEALREHPGNYHPRAIAGGVMEDDTDGAHDGSKYPLRWNEILAEPLLELMYRHRGQFLLEMPRPNRYWYR